MHRMSTLLCKGRSGCSLLLNPVLDLTKKVLQQSSVRGVFFCLIQLSCSGCRSHLRWELVRCFLLAFNMFIPTLDEKTG